MRNIRVASVQFEPVAGDKRANLAIIESFVSAAALRGVQILAFPECCITGYWFLRNLTRAQLSALSEPVPGGPSSRQLSGLAVSYGMTIGAGLVEVDESGRLFNTYAVALPDGTVHRHRKIQAFEHADISAGDSYTVFDTPHGVRVGVLICYDNNIIENVRITALMGAELLLAPHQTGGCDSISPHGMKPVDKAIWDRRDVDPESARREILGPKGREWLMRWLPSRAHDNGMFILFSNGIGRDDDEIRTGHAMILDPYGRIVAETGALTNDMVVADLDAALLENCTGQRWMRARLPELYGPLTQRTGREMDTRAVRFGKK
jgi:predicted amidohydrolase